MGYLKKILVGTKISFLKFHVTSRDFKTVYSDIATSNLKMLESLSLILSLIFGFLLLLSFVTTEPILNSNRYVYVGLFSAMIFIGLFSRFVAEKHGFFILPLCYFFLVCVNVYSISVGVFNDPTVYAVSFSATICISPILFVERARRMNCFSTIAEVIFIFLSFHEKNRSVAMMDFLNSVSFWILSCLLVGYMNHIRVSDFLLRKTIQNEADFDGLTSVLKKSAFMRDVQRFLYDGKHNGTFFIIDIDNFKKVNDTYGHLAGDKIIKNIAMCIKKTFRSSDFIGRFGGDEFVVFMPDNYREKTVSLKSVELLNLIKNTVVLPDSSGFATVSIGAALPENPSDPYDNLFRKADDALYKAKRNGKNTFEIIK